MRTHDDGVTGGRVATSPQSVGTTLPSISVQDVRIPGHDSAALLVRPVGVPVAAIMWMHWLGNERSDRTHFLSEAIDLANLGCASLLPTGQFPWQSDPTGTAADSRLVSEELDRARTAYTWLESLDGVDPDRVAVVGHDYGAMYALAGWGFTARAVVAVAPDADWSHWFCRHWLGDRSPGEHYRTAFRRSDPLRGAAARQADLLLQWAQHDEYVPPGVPALYRETAPRAEFLVYPGRDHRVGGNEPRADRRRFLTQRLGLAR